MDREPPEPGDSSAMRLFEAGADLAGATTGATAGFLVAGPAGAVGGAAAGSALASVLKEFAHRLLGRRQEVRVGAVARFAATALSEGIEAGLLLRTDGFFADSKGDGKRSAAEEIVEGVFLSAQQEHEERKVEYIGNLLANIAFRADIDQSLANWLISVTAELTWTQLVLLSAVQRKSHVPLPDVEIGSNARSWQSWGIHSQLHDLGPDKRALIGVRGGTRASDSAKLRSHDLRNGGVLLFDMLSLDRISISECIATLSSLTASPPKAQQDALTRQREELLKTFSPAEAESMTWLCPIHSWHSKVEATYISVPGVPDSLQVQSLRCLDCGALTMGAGVDAEPTP